MNVIALRHEAVLRYAGSYDMSPPSPSSALTCRRSVAWIVPSVIGSVYSRPVRLSVTVSVSSAMPSPSSSSFLDRLRSPVDEVAVPLRFPGAPPARRVDSARPRARSQGRSERDLDLRPRHLALAAAAGLPRDRSPEGRDDRAVRVSPLAPRHHRALLEGGQLLRPPLVARRGLVPGPVPPSGGRAARGRGKPELPLPPARARARPFTRPGRKADRARAQPGRPRLLAVPARGG